ncbi:NADH:ubiquinone oxidoreductase [Mycolicibacterium iranicum]|uniref:NADH:ubiquinone oxidoreductase n=2 Tax=Mycolicibacterium iranicum TaxID=912594 RepID=A0A178M2H2_MYCIR|nr:NADH:ubiquinone oxidoreductase [Mycolicibacterium iranicum]
MHTGLVVACSALLAVSCGSVGQRADADMTTSAPATVADASEVVLVDLRDADEVARWTTVNDPVMGGKSTSRIAYAEGGLVFSGTISLENNGGFASARGPQNPEIGRRATGADSLRVSAVGDGKTYLLKVGEAGQSWSYVQRFATEPGVGRSYSLPVAGFEPVGQRLDPEPNAPATLDPSTINQVSLYILDKQQGPFEITVSAIDAVPA